MSKRAPFIALVFVLLCGCASHPRPQVAGVRQVWVLWEYPPDDVMLFNVRRLATNTVAFPSLDWPIIATVPWHYYFENVNPTFRCCWYGVTATNPGTGLESTFATTGTKDTLPFQERKRIRECQK